jgi:hypothetical protein
LQRAISWQRTVNIARTASLASDVAPATTPPSKPTLYNSPCPTGEQADGAVPESASPERDSATVRFGECAPSIGFTLSAPEAGSNPSPVPEKTDPLQHGPNSNGWAVVSAASTNTPDGLAQSEGGCCDYSAALGAVAVLQKASALRGCGLQLTAEQERALSESDFVGGLVALLRAALAEASEAWQAATEERSRHAEARARLRGVEHALRCVAACSTR